jgi:uncharacterized protein YegL
MAQTLAKLLPFYLVIDVSHSMSGAPLESANKIMPAVVDTLAQDPILSDKVRFGLIDFASDARVQLPLCDVLDANLVLPDLQVRGATSYAAAFTLLRSEIESNIKQLKADGYAVHRPAVFFLSDGTPTDPADVWQSAFRDLITYDPSTKTGFAMFPNVVPCGVGGADPKTLKSLIHPATGPKAMQMYLMDKGENPAAAITAIAEILISSMLSSGQSMAQGSAGIILPDKEDVPKGITAYTSEDFV